MQAIPIRKAAVVVMFVALLFAAHPAIAAAAGGDQAKPPKIFASEATLTMTLTAPWQEFLRSKNSKKRYPGTLEYIDDSGAKHSMPVAFEPRGKQPAEGLQVCPDQVGLRQASHR